MARHFEQVKKMREKVARLKERARTAGDPKMADKYDRRANEVLRSIQAIIDNWRKFGERARGNTNFKGRRHSPEAREQMSRARKEFWASEKGRQKMWRARKRRQYREAGSCHFRFPRLPSSVDPEWLKDYRDRYKRVIGTRPKIIFADS